MQKRPLPAVVIDHIEESRPTTEPRVTVMALPVSAAR